MLTKATKTKLSSYKALFTTAHTTLNCELNIQLLNQYRVGVY